MEEKKDISHKEKRVRSITHLYYSKPEIQKIIVDFCRSREVSPRYFEGFGKRPDTIEYPGDLYQLVKRGATSFHCSQETFSDPLEIQTGMAENQLNELRTGWDLLIDIDCKWFDYSKLAARSIIKALKNYGVKNIGIKFSGSKGFHIIVPWKAFPKEINGEPTKNLFPEVPRKIVSFLRSKSEEEMKNILPNDFYNQFKGTEIKKGKKCNSCGEMSEDYLLVNYGCTKCRRKELKKKRLHEELKELKCPECSGKLVVERSEEFNECKKCGLNSKENPNKFSRNVEVDLFELMGLDLILVSPRHLFRAPYSLHEKTALASIVIPSESIEDFQPMDADPMKARIIDFNPNSEEGEARELLIQALDWYKSFHKDEDFQKESNNFEFKPIKIENLSEKNFPPSIKKILEGIEDGRKRALFILLNFFRSLSMEREELEQRIYEWNEKNKPPLKQGYIKTQIVWSYRNKIVPPPNFDKDYYNGIGIVPTEEELRYKNPVNYTSRKSFSGSGKKTRPRRK